MTTLEELAAMLDAATGPSSYLDTYIHTWTIALGLDHFEQGQHYPFTSSIDAALALAERLLTCSGDGEVVYDLQLAGSRNEPEKCWSAAPLAILRALVAALIAQEKTND